MLSHVNVNLSNGESSPTVQSNPDWDFPHRIDYELAPTFYNDPEQPIRSVAAYSKPNHVGGWIGIVRFMDGQEN